MFIQKLARPRFYSVESEVLKPEITRIEVHVRILKTPFLITQSVECLNSDIFDLFLDITNLFQGSHVVRYSDFDCNRNTFFKNQF